MLTSPHTHIYGGGNIYSLECNAEKRVLPIAYLVFGHVKVIEASVDDVDLRACRAAELSRSKSNYIFGRASALFAHT